MRFLILEHNCTYLVQSCLKYWVWIVIEDRIVLQIKSVSEWFVHLLGLGFIHIFNSIKMRNVSKLQTKGKWYTNTMSRTKNLQRKAFASCAEELNLRPD